MVKATIALLFLFAAVASYAEEAVHSTDSAETIKKAVDDGKAVLIDVREKDEWDVAHVKSATLIPGSTIKVDAKKAAEALPKDKAIYVHCAVGGRALRCAKEWKALGYDVRPVTYNVSAFEKAGFPVEKGTK